MVKGDIQEMILTKIISPAIVEAGLKLGARVGGIGVTIESIILDLVLRDHQHTTKEGLIDLIFYSKWKIVLKIL